MADDKTVVDDPILATGKLFHALAADPRYRKKVLGLVKEASPDTVIPELDMADAAAKQAEERTKPLSEKLDKAEKRLEEMERREARAKWANTHGLDDEEVVEVEKLAQEKGITKADTAVEFYRATGKPRSTRKPPAGDTTYMEALSKIDPRNGPQLKKLATARATEILSSRRAG